MPNSNFANAKKAKNDEFYTQYGDIQKEIEAYLDYDANVFRGKVVYCNCDDPFESNFFMYFANKFKDYGLKKLIATSYVGSPIAQTKMHFPGFDESVNNKVIPDRKNRKAFKIEINEASDHTKDGITNLDDVKWLIEHDKNASSPLNGDEKYPAGDFRSSECVELLKQSDIVVTNPPFSLFREYIKQLMEYNKKFVIIGNMNAITYKEFFPLIKDNRIWFGAGKNDGRNVWYQVPDNYESFHKEEDGKKYAFVAGTVWFTNLDHGRRHQVLPLMTEAEIIKFGTKKPFEKYDNYNAIEVSLVKNIPSDYDGVMGVPISFLSKYSPEQFQILGETQRGCHDEVPDTKKYNDYWEVRQDGQKTGSSGGKTNENANLVGNDGKKNYFINQEGRIVQSAYQRIFIKHKEKTK